MKQLKKNLCTLFSAIMMCLCIVGCKDPSASQIHANAETFLTFIYTTDKDQRYTEYSSGDMSDETAVDKYYSEISDIVDDALLEQLSANRIPAKYDDFYIDDPVVVDSVSIEENGERYDFTVSAHNNAGDITFEGQISLDEDEKINYFYEAA